jgi:N-acetylmuramoyl-L-alanine amidase
MLGRVVRCGGGIAGLATAVLVVGAGTPASAAGGSITALSPASGLVSSTLEIDGTGLAGAKDVSFDGANGSTETGAPVSGDDTHLLVTVPVGTTSGPVNVTLKDGSSATSPSPFTVLPTATLDVTPASVTYPAPTTVTATLTSAGQPVPGQPSSLQSRPSGSTDWTTTAGPATDANGAVVYTVVPRINSDYRVVFGATSAYGEATSAFRRVSVSPLVGVRSPAIAPILTATPILGTIRPVVDSTLRLERWTSGTWKLVALATTDATGRYRVNVVLPAKGPSTYRIRRLADAGHAATITPPFVITGVDRSLHYGNRGSDVVVLQKRLIALHYDVPRLTGVVDFDTLHAIYAFEKVQRLTRDGVVSTAVWKRLGSPVLPKLLHPLAGVAAVEVDLTKQVLYYAVNAKIVRILDVSSGGGYRYTGSDGRPAVAITPTGHFHVVYKINRWVTSKLGTLYRPAYFNNSGYAIHGETLVPPYPASHGCIRITVPAMDRMYDKLVQGLSVWIYRS